MKEVLYNLANFHLIDFCKSNNIDCSGTFTIKSSKRGFTYDLRKEKTGQKIVSVTLTKNTQPKYIIF